MKYLTLIVDLALQVLVVAAIATRFYAVHTANDEMLKSADLALFMFVCLGVQYLLVKSSSKGELSISVSLGDSIPQAKLKRIC